MYKLWYLCGDLCDIKSTVCWRNSIKTFQEMDIASRSWNKLDKNGDSDQKAVSKHLALFHGVNKAAIYDSCTVTFVKQPVVLTLWITEKINA